jgi:hypothetical protein
LSILRDAALEYRDAGLHVIPLLPRSKRPLVSWREFQDRMPTVEEIDGWFSVCPDANIALVMGRGVFAVDVDGVEGDQALAAAGIDLSTAPRSKTSRGYHVFFKGQEIPDRIGLLPKVDVRGVGYVVAPPSVHESGHVYEWVRPIEGVLPLAPERLYDLIRRPTVSAPAIHGTDWFTQALVGVAEGGRDSTCTRLAGRLLGAGLPQEAVELILQSWAERCSPPFPPDQVSKCVESIAKREGAPAGPPGSIAEAVAKFLGEVERPRANMAATEFKTMDERLDGGFEPGLILMGARPSVGKSALALDFARKNAVKRGVLYISREMPVSALVRRMVSQTSGGALPISDLKTGKLADVQKLMLPVVAKRLAALNMWLTTDVVSTPQLEAALDVFTPGTLGLVIVDYLQLMKAAEPMRDARQRVEAVSEELKRLAIKSELPFLVLSSLSRPPKGAPGWRPQLSDLRESGELEHDADVVLLLHRDLDGPDSGVMEVNFAKQRDGSVGNDVRLAFDGPTVSFKELR